MPVHQCMRNLDWVLVGEFSQGLEAPRSSAGDVLSTPCSVFQQGAGLSASSPGQAGRAELGTAGPQPAWGPVFRLTAVHHSPPACESPRSLGGGVGGEGRGRRPMRPTTLRGLLVRQLTLVGQVRRGTGAWITGTDSS